ncbi:unnamed protein product [Allacma fusca]|uniref:LRRCT domain-containing protein n=1 Tax=Allacma fusca TaxID=39272 RepID=A0A8J2KS26_9HEXA|nr:unnamed protein product [Allacma fusca]
MGALSQLVSLRLLDLRSNQLDTLEEKVFENLTGLESLDISQNPLKVIVNGVFQHLTKLSRLHLSRLMDKNLEFDSSSSFHPLINLDILELDDSPSLALSIFRDGALSYFLSLVQLNLQRCQLQDLQLVSTSIHESAIFDSLRELRLSGNPWDCSNFSPDSVRDFLHLHSKGIVVDVDQMLCSEPRGIKVISVALNHSSSNESESSTPRPAAGSAKLEITEKPTRSYFEDLTHPTTTMASISARRSRRKGKKGPDVENKLFPPTHTPPRPDQNVKEHEEVQTNMKTNDDNAIIDDERSPMSSKQQQPHQQQPTWFQSKEEESFRKNVGGSIDGFPALYSHPKDGPVTNQPHTSSHIKNSPQPNPSYLKSYPERMSSNLDEPSSPHTKKTTTTTTTTTSPTTNSTVILKTLIILAVACLLSILFLLSLSLIVFRFSSSASAQSLSSSWRLKKRSFPSAAGRSRRKWDKASEECISVSNNALSSYENLNPTTPHRGPTGMSYTRLGDQDTVELSGITNRLYFENEDIYHIT